MDGTPNSSAEITLDSVGKRYPDGTDAVGSLTLDIPAGELVVLIGPSGCGKSTILRMINRLIEPTSGRILLGGADVHAGSAVDLRRRIGYVIQNVGLFPHQTIRANVATVPRLLGWPKRRVEERATELLELVGLDPRQFGRRYPHELSGGQRQRVGIARSLILEPSVLIADEPVSALDVSVQASILNLLRDLQRDMGFSCLFITHDLATVEYLCDRIAVMYLGKMVELASRDAIFSDPQHPYTQSLLSAAVVPDPVEQRKRRRVVLEGDPPSPLAPPSGCRFHTRCPLHDLSAPACEETEPLLREFAPDHLVACHLVSPGSPAPRIAAEETVPAGGG
ncbi:MAG TPA: ABC transporter ATP-binding protein [Gaiellaceae bacterium]|nr:ABC transporter ATP-binding protein [Gaiellaceae bacterium]